MGKRTSSAAAGGKGGHDGASEAPRGPGGSEVAPVGQEVDLSGGQPIESGHWCEMAEPLPKDSRLLQCNPLYTMPPALLDALSRHAPELLGEDRDPEERLSGYCQANDLDGFWYRRPFNYPQLRPHHHEDLLDKKHVDGYGAQWGSSKAEVKERCDNVLAPAITTGNRMQGYLGWLVTEPAYRRELDALRAEGQAAVEEAIDVGAFNYIPTGEDFRRLGFPVSAAAGRFCGAYQQFCQRWCLQGLITWDLPVPRNPDWGTSIDAAGERVPAEGILLFVPYTFIPHGNVDLSAIAAHLQQSGIPDQLRGWLDKGSEGRRGEGEERFASLFLFQHYWNVILGRYGDRIGRSKTKVKAALGEYLVGAGSWGDRPGLEMANKLFTLMGSRIRSAESTSTP